MSDYAHCKYHPKTPARWYCPECHVDFCSACVNDIENQEPPNCAICGEALDDNGLEAFIPPIWQRISLFFKIPLDSDVLFLIFGLIVTGILGLLIPVLGFLVTFIILPIIFVKYGYLLMEEVACGNLEAPRLNQLWSDGEYSIVFKQLFVFIVLFIPIAILSESSFLLLFVYYLMVLLLIPATVMVLVMEKSAFKALNPIILFEFIKRIGSSYWGLCLLLMLINGGPGLIMEIVIELFYQDNVGLMDLIHLFAFFAILQMYFSLVIFAAMGYLLLKYHHRLGYRIEANVDDFTGGYTAPPAVNPVLKDIEVLMRENKSSKALKVLRTRLKDNFADMEVRKRYHKLLLLNNKNERLVQHGDDLINFMLVSDSPGDAIEIYQDCKTAEQAFNPSRKENYLPLGEIMLRLGHYKWIIQLFKKVHVRFPDKKLVPQWYFLMAKALSEGFQQDDKAKQVLLFVLKNYPKAENKKEIVAYLKLLQQMHRSPQKPLTQSV